MKIDKIERLYFDEFRDIFFRLSELKNFGKEHRIKTAMVVINYSMQDINHVINTINVDKTTRKDTGVFYQLMVKSDLVLHSIETIIKDLNLTQDKEDEIIKQVRSFKLLRSLTIAHPLDTTRYKDFGYSNEEMKWCEDVRPHNGFTSFIIQGDFDFVLSIIKENSDGLPEYRGINIETDIIGLVRNLILLFNSINIKLRADLEVEINKLKETPIKIDNTNAVSYFDSLIENVKRRYPTKIEVVEYADRRIIESSILHTVKKLCMLKLPIEQELHYTIFRENLMFLVRKYEEALQKMELESYESQEELDIRNIIHPSSIKLKTKLFGTNKIIEYLSESRCKSISNLFKEEFDISHSSNGEYGVCQLLELKEELEGFFPIHFDMEDQDLYAQYIAALYFMNRKKIEDKPKS